MSEEIKECGRCGRRIKSKKAMELGYGPVCWVKEMTENAVLVEAAKEVGKDGSSDAAKAGRENEARL